MRDTKRGKKVTVPEGPTPLPPLGKHQNGGSPITAKKIAAVGRQSPEKVNPTSREHTTVWNLNEVVKPNSTNHLDVHEVNANLFSSSKDRRYSNLRRQSTDSGYHEPSNSISERRFSNDSTGFRRLSNASSYQSQLSVDSNYRRRLSTDSNFQRRGSIDSIYQRRFSNVSDYQRRLSYDSDNGQRRFSNASDYQRRLSNDSISSWRYSKGSHLSLTDIVIKEQEAGEKEEQEKERRNGTDNNNNNSNNSSSNNSNNNNNNNSSSSNNSNNNNNNSNNNVDNHSPNKHPFNRSPSTTSCDLTPSATETKGGTPQRRWSKPSFSQTSRRVRLLLRANSCFYKLNSKKKGGDDKKAAVLVNPPEEELPKIPRFSTFMSAEAQFALLKGYEDILHEKLAAKFPEYNGMLKRNRTPIQRVNIRRKNSVDGLEDAEEEDENVDDADKEESPKTDVNTQYDAHTNEKWRKENQSSLFLTENRPLVYETDNRSLSLPFSPSMMLKKSVSLPMTSTAVRSRSIDTSSIRSEPMLKSNPNVALRNLRRLSVSLTNPNAGYPEPNRRQGMRKIFGDGDEDEEGEDGFYSLRRYGSMPSVSSLPHDRRIVMSHKLENAMDILDVIKAQEGHTLSPRTKVKDRTKLAPLSAYNSWAADWNKEFKVQ